MKRSQAPITPIALVPPARASLLGFAGAGAAGLIAARWLFLIASGTPPWGSFQGWVYHGAIPLVVGGLAGGGVWAARRVVVGRKQGVRTRLMAGLLAGLLLLLARRILAALATMGAVMILGVPVAHGNSLAIGLGLMAALALPPPAGGSAIPIGIPALWFAVDYGWRFETLRAVLAGGADGAGLAVAMLLASRASVSGRSGGPRLRWPALGIAVALAAVLGLSRRVQSSVEARCKGIEEILAQVRESDRWHRDPAFARLCADVLVRLGKAREWARFPLKYSLSWYGPFEGQLPLLASGHRLDRWLDDAQDLAELLHTAAHTTAGGTVRPVRRTPWYAPLLGDFSVPCVVEERESPRLRSIVALYRGGFPIASIAALEDPTLVRDYETLIGASASEHAPGWRYRKIEVGGRAIDVLDLGLPSRAGQPRYFEIKAPSESARMWLARRMAAPSVSPLTPADLDAYVETSLSRTPPTSETEQILEQRVPLVGDLHMHTNSTFSAMAPAGLVARTAFAQMMDVVAITEHWGSNANHLARVAIPEFPSAPLLIRGEEVSLAKAHVTALCIPDWIEAAWFTFDADPYAVAALIRARGGLPVLAHPFYPPEDWQADALLGWPREPFAAIEDSHWVPDKLWESCGERLRLLGVSDAHQACFAGEPRTLLMVKERTEQGVREAIESGHCAALDAGRPGFCRGSPRMRAVVAALLARGQDLDRQFFAHWRGRAVLDQPIEAWTDE